MTAARPNKKMNLQRFGKSLVHKKFCQSNAAPMRLNRFGQAHKLTAVDQLFCPGLAPGLCRGWYRIFSHVPSTNMREMAGMLKAIG
jgi:hypothetical protein